MEDSFCQLAESRLLWNTAMKQQSKTHSGAVSMHCTSYKEISTDGEVRGIK